MAIASLVFPRYRLFVVYFSGRVTDDDIIQTYHQLFINPDVKPGFNDISFSTGETELLITERSLAAVMAARSKFHGDGETPRSLHVLHSDGERVLSETYQCMASWATSYTEVIETYTHLDEALASLGLRLEMLPALEQIVEHASIEI